MSGEIIGWGTGAGLLRQLIKGVEEKTGEKVVSVHGHKTEAISKIKPSPLWDIELRCLLNDGDITFQQAVVMIQRQAIEATAQDIAENAKIRAFDGHWQQSKRMEHIQVGANNYTVSKESILERINSPELKVI